MGFVLDSSSRIYNAFFANTILIIDLGKSHQWMLKPLGWGLLGKKNIHIVFKSVTRRLFTYKGEKISFKWRDLADIAFFNWSNLILPIMGQIETICFIRCIKKGCNVICVVFLPNLFNLNVTMRKKKSGKPNWGPSLKKLGRILKMSMSWEPIQCPRLKES